MSSSKFTSSHDQYPRKSPMSTSRWLLGMFIASIFSFVYLLTPLYFLTTLLCLLFQFPTKVSSYWIASPLIVSIFLTKPIHAPRLVRLFKPVLDYFQYEEVCEISNEDLLKLTNNKGKRFIVASQPHGVISFCGICAAINATPEVSNIKTAAASAVLQTPFIKNVMGIFGLIDASSSNLRKHFQKPGINGCVVIYIGGIAELFKSSRKEERLYLSKRKGFIKIALREEGLDIIPTYLFGNTSVLTVVKTGMLATLSRRIGASLTYFWGKYFLPIPRDDKLLYVRGSPMQLPDIPNPTDDDVNKWHAKYCEEVTKLFDKYKERVPMYKDKKLYID